MTLNDNCQTEAVNAKVGGGGGVSSYGGKKGGQLQTKNVVGIAYFIFTLFCEIHDIHCMESFLEEFGSLFFLEI